MTQDKVIHISKEAFTLRTQEGIYIDKAERHDLKSRFLPFILLIFFTLFLGGKRKEENNNQSRDFKLCLSA